MILQMEIVIGMKIFLNISAKMNVSRLIIMLVIVTAIDSYKLDKAFGKQS